MSAQYVDLARNLTDHPLLWCIGSWAIGLATGLIVCRSRVSAAETGSSEQ